MIWKAVPGYPSYEVSASGQVRRVLDCRNSKAGRVLQACLRPNGYRFVGLCRGGKVARIAVHQIVMLAFCGPADGRVVNHKDLNRQNNNLDNLEYVSQAENCQHSFRSGASCFRGERNGQAKLTEFDVRFIRANADPSLSARANAIRFAEHFGVSFHQVSKVLRGKAWAHLSVGE